MTEKLTAGDTAPTFILDGARGERVDLAGLRGGRVIVYFYPKASTPGCTTEACDFRDNLAALRGEGYSVLGVSPDPIADLEAFGGEHGLGYPLLSDPEALTARAWGAWGEVTFGGQTRVGLVRSTFVLDGEGRVLIAQYGVSADGHVGELRAELARL